MTASAVLNALSSTIDALRLGRLTVITPAPAAPRRAPAPLIEMACPRCGHSVKATIPPDDEPGQNLAFNCTGCGVAASWV